MTGRATGVSCSSVRWRRTSSRRCQETMAASQLLCIVRQAGRRKTSINRDFHLMANGSRTNAPVRGSSKVYVTIFPPTGERWQVSVDGGVQPMWRRDGREAATTWLSTAPSSLSRFARARVSRLACLVRSFRAPVGAVNVAVEQYATVDGERFLVRKQVERPSRPINVVVNWPLLLKK